MDSHSYSGYNVPGSSFLQELTVEDASKDVYSGGQFPQQQQRQYQTYQDPNTSNYPTAAEAPPNAYYNGQYNVDPYYYNHPSYQQRTKYPESYQNASPMQTLPHSQMPSRSVSGQSAMNANWADNPQQSSQYHPDSYPPPSTFHTSGEASRMSAPNYPPSHMVQARAMPPQQSYQTPPSNPYSTVSGQYCHGDMPSGYSNLPPTQQQMQAPSVPQQQHHQPSMHSVTINGESMNLYAPQSRMSQPLLPQSANSSMTRQQLPKSFPKRPPKPRINTGGSNNLPLSNSPYSQHHQQHPMHEPAALERFVNTQYPPNTVAGVPTSEFHPMRANHPPPPPHLQAQQQQHQQQQHLPMPQSAPNVGNPPMEQPMSHYTSPQPPPSMDSRRPAPNVAKPPHLKESRVYSPPNQAPSVAAPPVLPPPAPVAAAVVPLQAPVLPPVCENAPREKSPEIPPSMAVPATVDLAPQLAVQAANVSPRLEEPQEASPPPPNLKSSLPIQSPSVSNFVNCNNPQPPVLPKEASEVETEAEVPPKLEEVAKDTKKVPSTPPPPPPQEPEKPGPMSVSEEAPAPMEVEEPPNPDLRAEKSSQKQTRGRKRKLEAPSDVIGDAETNEPHNQKKGAKSATNSGKRKASESAKRLRRKTIVSKAVEEPQEEEEVKSESEAPEPAVELVPAVPEPADDEDTMAASVAPIEGDEESATATPTTTTTTVDDTPAEVVLKCPRPPPRVRAPRPKKKRTLKSLMKKKRRGAYHFGDDSDGSESDDEVPSSSKANHRPKASSSSASFQGQVEDDNSMDSSARRSGRRGQDKKRYTMDSVDFGLSDDGEGDGAAADGSDFDATGSSRKASDVDFVDVKVVEKILGRRMATRPVKKETSRAPKPLEEEKLAEGEEKPSSSGKAEDCQMKSGVETEKEEPVEQVQLEEFYLKYKGFSYMHCEWKALDEIADPRIGTKLKKYLSKCGSDCAPGEDEDGSTGLFNPDYVEVDRVLDIRIYDRVSGEIVTEEVLNPDGSLKRVLTNRTKKRGRPPRSKQRSQETEDEEAEEAAASPDEIAESEDEQPATVTYYLVKWRSLPYEDSTWELAEDVDPVKVKEFMRIRNPPKGLPVARDSSHKIIRPSPSEWTPIGADEEYKNGNRLREYQVEGVNWLAFCWYNNRNCILADEMGLGKTVQSIAFLLEVVKAGVPGPFLIIVPLSTVGNWQREFQNWSDLNAIVYHGSATSRSMIQEYELFYHRRKGGSSGNTVSSSSSSNLFSAKYRTDVYKFNALITTFEVLMSDIEFFSKMHWAVAIIDEAHRLKNKKCKLGEGLRYLDFDHRVLLTGTPLQNNVEELFGLLNFLDPQRFSCAASFMTQFGELKTEQQVEDLKSLLKPMMLRRLKEDVEKSLAPKEETIIEVELTNLQKKYYRAIMERNFTFLCKGTTGANMPNLMNVMMELRKCCNHPFLIKGAEDAILAEQRVLAEADPSKPYNEEQQMFSALLNASGKLVLIHKLLPKLKAGGHKVLIFSQMIRVLDILEDYMVYQGFSFERIDGRIHGLMRQEAIDRFCNDPEKFVFLLCTKAGGLGINLTAADVVIIYDSDWNPQNDLQAQARCHRIGQQKMVKVYRLITRNTYEREMFDRASLKLGLDKAVLQSTGAHAKQPQLGKKEVEELLKKGAYGALMDDDKAGDDFCEEDIDQILQSRSHVVQLDQGEKNSTFSKATFSVSDNRNDIALDDPDFWQKWAKKAGVEEVDYEFEDLIMTTPRQRRQTNRYTAELNEQQSSSSLAHSQSASRLQNGNNGRGAADSNAETSDGENSSAESSGGDDDGATIGSNTGCAGGKSKHKKGKKGRRGEGGIDRVDLFRVERCLFTWSWGRWAYALECVPFKQPISELEMQRIARCILGFALKATPPQTGMGDMRVRAVIGEMIRSSEGPDSLKSIAEVAQAVKSGGGGVMGGSVLPRRGRRTVKTDSPNPPSTPNTPGFDAESGAVEGSKTEEHDVALGREFGIRSESFQRHLGRAGGRLLIRVYTLYFLHVEIVGLELAEGLCDGSIDHTAFTELEKSLPHLKALDADVPADWWDSCCDKCLLLGVFKHGWEKYLAIRDDPAFCFYRHIYGPNAPTIPIPSTAGSLRTVRAETPTTEMEASNDVKPDGEDRQQHQGVEKPPLGDDEKTPEEGKKGEEEGEETKAGELPEPIQLFPAVVDLNSRTRKLIAYFQRIRAQFEIESLQSLRPDHMSAANSMAAGGQPYMEQRVIKWSRREEADFYRVVSSFGVEQVLRSPPHSPSRSHHQQQHGVLVGYNWSNFKVLANLGKKSDQAITEYYNAFLTMCHRVCKEPLPEGTPAPVCSLPTTTTFGSCTADDMIPVAPISEERATRTLSRIRLLNRIRSSILPHEHLEERLALCQRSSDLPEWWVPGKHDLELLQAVARHGLARTDLNILPDKRFSFSRVTEMVRRQLLKNPAALRGVMPPSAASAAAAASSADAAISGSEVEARASLAAAASVAARAVAAELEAKLNDANAPSISETDKPENSGLAETVGESSGEHFTWSLQFATSLAVAWPKDRTIHNRLEMVCQCVESGHWPLPRRYLVNSAGGGVDDMVRYHLAESTGSRDDASPAPPSSPDVKKSASGFTSSEAATLAALSAAGYTSFDQVLALQAAMMAAAAASGSSQQQAQQEASSSRGGAVSRRGTRGGRGRGRGSRGGTGGMSGGYSREDFASVAALSTPTRGRGSRGGQMLPPRGSAGTTRGRKRKFESGSVELSTGGGGKAGPSSSNSSASLPPPDSPAWEVNVPLISLVNGSLIHGDKAPKRRHLEAWLEAHPDYMPYSVEPEDQVIFNRVAKARGQNTSAMEVLAYRHYLSNLMSKMAGGYGASTSQQQQQLHAASTPAADMVEAQQKQLMATFLAASMYSNNPAYASLIASALAYSSQAASVGAQHVQQQQSQQSSSSSATTQETEKMPAVTASSSSSQLGDANPSSSSNAPTESTPAHAEAQQSNRIGASESASAASGSSGSQMTAENLQSMMAAYQQTASLLSAYVYNPALYGAAAAAAGSGAGASTSSSAAAAAAAEALQRQQMSALLSSMFAMTSQQQQAQSAPQQTSSSEPPAEPSTSAAAAPVSSPAEPSRQELVLPPPPPPEPVEGAPPTAASAGSDEGDVLDLSKPE